MSHEFEFSHNTGTWDFCHVCCISVFKSGVLWILITQQPLLLSTQGLLCNKGVLYTPFKWPLLLGHFCRSKCGRCGIIWHLQRWRYKKIKGKSVLFSFFYPFIFLALSSFPYFCPFTWLGSGLKVKVKSRWNWYRALSGRLFFFSAETISKGDNIKIKRKVSPCFFLLPVYLPCIAVLSPFLSVYIAWKRPKSLVKSRWNWCRALIGRVMSGIERSYKNCKIYKNSSLYHLQNQQNLFKRLQGSPVQSYKNCENYEIYENC